MMRESFLEQVLSQATAWLLTYGIHSTVLLGSAWLILRTRLVRSLASQDVIWKAALLGALATATLHSALDLPRWSQTRESGVAATTAPVPLRAAPSFEAPTRRAVNSHALAQEPRTARHARAAVAASARARSLTGEHEVASASLPWALIALVGWIATASLALTRLFATRLRLHRHLGARRDVTDSELSTLLERLCREAGVRRPVRLSVSPFLSTPIAYKRSEICVPPRALTELTRRQQEAMLAHELAHLVRRDPAWRTITALLRSVFFVQPLNAVAARRIHALAELLCDDWAVRRTGRRLVLAQCLAKVAGWIDEDRAAVPAAGMAQPGSNLVQRVQRLAAPAGNRPRVRSRRTGFAAATLLLAVSCGMPTVSSSETQGFVARCMSLLQGSVNSRASEQGSDEPLGLQLVAASTTHFTNLADGRDRGVVAQGCEHCDHCRRNARQETAPRTRDKQLEQLSRELEELARQLDRQAEQLERERRGSRAQLPPSRSAQRSRPLPGAAAERLLEQGRMHEALEAYRRALPTMPRPLQEPRMKGRRPSPWPGEWKQPTGNWTPDDAQEWAREWEGWAEGWAEEWAAEWEGWAEEYTEELEEQAEQFEAEWEEWAEEHSAEWETWADEFHEQWNRNQGSELGKRQRAWAERWGRDHADRFQAWEERYRRLYGGRNCDHDCKRRCRNGCTHPDDDGAESEDEQDEGSRDAFVRTWPSAASHPLPPSLIDVPTLRLGLPARTLTLPALAPSLPFPSRTR